MESAGFDLTDNGGFLTHINGIPASPGPQDWWSYWQLSADADGRYAEWNFSQFGMDSSSPLGGSVEGWSLHDSYSVEAPPPAQNPLEGYTAPPKEEPTEPVVIPDAQLRACINRGLAQPATAAVGAEQAAAVTELNCFYGGIRDLTGLEKFTGLTSLDLTLNDVTDTTPLAGLTQLSSLVLDGNEISDVSPLAGLEGLTSLDLDGNQVSDLRPLGALSLLEVLSVADQRGTTPLSGLDGISALGSLRELNVSQNALSTLEPVSDLAGLRKLLAYDNAITDLSSLTRLTGLTALNLHTNGLADISALTELSALTSLNLAHNDVVDISALSGLSALTDLTLSNNPVGDHAPLEEMTALTDLRLDGTGMRDASVLGAIDALNWVILHDNHLSDVSVLATKDLRGWGALDQTLEWPAAIAGEPAPRPVVTDETGAAIAVPLPEGAVVEGDSVVWSEPGTFTLRFSSPSRKFAGTVTVHVEPARPSASPTPTEAPTSADPSPTDAPTVQPSAVPSPPPAAVEDLYVTPGMHEVAGRRWFTSCEPYSQTQRCTTLIWASTVRDGQRVDGWTFNTLTYRASSKSLWTGNPLATPGEHVVDGRQWRTQCNTALTGGNGCRSFLWVRTPALIDGKVAVFEGWQLNNIVRFH
ncbi:hypothetical protein RPIT_08525 [Tessaracoccus flavus]|uniref:Leucine-rich repeat (LRR) protein n=1 Tax=Tessaracoccus flavus TaxID=1610493 RepID=A0A1Q2CFE6_9ACTN|nr:leucine-rich repeat domain-containing protein [Tessaracoccus flavus]AQP44831.1 hypothetical protein RPIT_08525 [Tessaracoccus flavus]